MKIVMACGGTGGHIFPAVSVSEELKKRNPATEIIYVCGNRDIETAIFKIIKQERVVPVTSAPFRGARSLFSPSFLLKLAKGLSESWRFLKKERPDAVAGFGGHFSFPMVVAAKLQRIPTLIHEQNVVPGSANKVLAKWVDGVALSFEQTEKYLPQARLCQVTGNPIREEIETAAPETAYSYFNFSKDKKTLMVLGGSQGSESINTFFLQALPLLESSLKDRLQVLHLCGKMSPAESEAVLNKQGITVRAFSFFERMDLAYAVADAAVGRAGATFLAEIDAKKIPAMLIPYPFANGHQALNAQAFAQTNAARVVEQKNLTAEGFASNLRWLLSENTAPHAGRRSDSRARLADFIERVAKK